MRQNFNFLHKWLIEQAARSTKQPFSRNRPPTSLSLQVRDRGFALPLAVGMGLIMILVGMTMVVRSQNDSVTASAQKSNSGALGAAETGITRYQALINNNRVIATYPACGNEAWTSSGTCGNTGPSPVSWGNPSTIEGIENPCTADSEITNVKNNAINSWQYVDDTSTTTKRTKGQYRLVSYTYQPNTGVAANQAPGTGTLVVEGRIGQVDNSDGTASLGISTGTTRLQVKIPVQETDPNSVPFPGLWIDEYPPKIPDNNTINGNLLVNGCSASSSDVGGNITGSRTSVPTLKFPDLPERPTDTSTYNDLRSVTIKTDEGTVCTSGGGCKTVIDSGVITGDNSEPILDFPSSVVGDKFTTDGAGNKVYKYRIKSIALAETIRIVPGSKVIFYIEEDIETGTNSIIHNYPSAPANFQIYAYANSGLSDTTTLTAPKICMQGNGETYGFLFAPEYEAGIKGGGSGAGFIGTIWVKQWSTVGSGCASSTSNSVVTQTFTNWSTLGMSPEGIPPTLAHITTWQRQEAN